MMKGSYQKQQNSVSESPHLQTTASADSETDTDTGLSGMGYGVQTLSAMPHVYDNAEKAGGSELAQLVEELASEYRALKARNTDTSPVDKAGRVRKGNMQPKNVWDEGLAIIREAKEQAEKMSGDRRVLPGALQRIRDKWDEWRGLLGEETHETLSREIQNFQLQRGAAERFPALAWRGPLWLRGLMGWSLLNGATQGLNAPQPVRLAGGQDNVVYAGGETYEEKASHEAADAEAFENGETGEPVGDIPLPENAFIDENGQHWVTESKDDDTQLDSLLGGDILQDRDTPQGSETSPPVQGTSQVYVELPTSAEESKNGTSPDGSMPDERVLSGNEEDMSSSMGKLGGTAGADGRNARSATAKDAPFRQHDNLTLTDTAAAWFEVDNARREPVFPGDQHHCPDTADNSVASGASGVSYNILKELFTNSLSPLQNFFSIMPLVNQIYRAYEEVKFKQAYNASVSPEMITQYQQLLNGTDARGLNNLYDATENIKRAGRLIHDPVGYARRLVNIRLDTYRRSHDLQEPILDTRQLTVKFQKQTLSDPDNVLPQFEFVERKNYSLAQIALGQHRTQLATDVYAQADPPEDAGLFDFLQGMDLQKEMLGNVTTFEQDAESMEALKRVISAEIDVAVRAYLQTHPASDVNKPYRDAAFGYLKGKGQVQEVRFHQQPLADAAYLPIEGGRGGLLLFLGEGGAYEIKIEQRRIGGVPVAFDIPAVPSHNETFRNAVLNRLRYRSTARLKQKGEGAFKPQVQTPLTIPPSLPILSSPFTFSPLGEPAHAIAELVKQRIQHVKEMIDDINFTPDELHKALRDGALETLLQLSDLVMALLTARPLSGLARLLTAGYFTSSSVAQASLEYAQMKLTTDPAQADEHAANMLVAMQMTPVNAASDAVMGVSQVTDEFLPNPILHAMYESDQEGTLRFITQLKGKLLGQWRRLISREAIRDSVAGSRLADEMGENGVRTLLETWLADKTITQAGIERFLQQQFDTQLELRTEALRLTHPDTSVLKQMGNQPLANPIGTYGGLADWILDVGEKTGQGDVARRDKVIEVLKKQLAILNKMGGDTSQWRNHLMDIDTVDNIFNELNEGKVFSRSQQTTPPLHADLARQEYQTLLSHSEMRRIIDSPLSSEAFIDSGLFPELMYSLLAYYEPYETGNPQMARFFFALAEWELQGGDKAKEVLLPAVIDARMQHPDLHTPRVPLTGKVYALGENKQTPLLKAARTWVKSKEAGKKPERKLITLLDSVSRLDNPDAIKTKMTEMVTGKLSLDMAFSDAPRRAINDFGALSGMQPGELLVISHTPPQAAAPAAEAILCLGNGRFVGEDIKGWLPAAGGRGRKILYAEELNHFEQGAWQPNGEAGFSLTALDVTGHPSQDIQFDEGNRVQTIFGAPPSDWERRGEREYQFGVNKENALIPGAPTHHWVVTVAAHGAPDKVNHMEADELYHALRAAVLRRNVSPENVSVIRLISCHTGKNDRAIGQKIADLFQKEVDSAAAKTGGQAHEVIVLAPKETITRLDATQYFLQFPRGTTRENAKDENMQKFSGLKKSTLVRYLHGAGPE
ncbi:hypothetical protein KH388_22180 [Serratia rubidaea]|nr:hypothetical protein [Serratia rubidaea]